MSNFTIHAVLTRDDLSAVASLFTSYANSLNLDLTFQDFATELSALPGKYGPPQGALLVACKTSDGQAIGCVGLRPLPVSTLCPDPSGICEMKRLYVSLGGRGLGVGKALAQSVIAEARTLGYRAMRLDTLPDMASARALYRALGFKEVAAYYNTPLEGTIFLEMDLINDVVQT